MVNVDIKVDTRQLASVIKKYPRASQLAVERYAEQVGRTIERYAKKRAPVISGYLRRSIFFVPAGGGSTSNFIGKGKTRVNQSVTVSSTGATVVAYANYAKQVHGAPYFRNPRPRKETPFFTYALQDGRGQIQQYANAIIPNIFNNIGRN